MITLTDLSKTFPGNIRALNGVNLEIGPGMFGLVGPNGAGKTTLMRILAGLVRPTSGSANVLGHDVTTAHGKLAAKALLGYLPQEIGLYPDLNAIEFLDYIATLKGIAGGRERRSQIDTALRLVHLTDVAGRRMKTFSGGMKRRVGVAQALLGNPALLIVDEPTAGLDPQERVHLRNLLADLAAERTVILSTHIVEDISQSCSDLAVLQQGRIIFRGSPQDLIEQAQGKVWLVVMNGQRPPAHLTVVSTINQGATVQYRLLGEGNEIEGATSIAPSLEDGYLWLMRRAEKNR